MPSENGRYRQYGALIAAEQSKVAAMPEFQDILRRIAQYQAQTANVIVENAQQQAMAVEALGAVRKDKKTLEGLRKKMVAYPRALEKSFNAFFKVFKNQCDSVEKKIIPKIQAFQRKEEERYEKERKEVEEKAGKEIQAQDIDAPPTTMPDTLPSAPPRKIEAGGTSFSEREIWQAEVIDKITLVRKALDSRVSKVTTDIIKIDMVELMKLVRAEGISPRQWEKYGVKAWKKKLGEVSV
jgi:hypothetical protein